ncbi:30S ribosomal protein S15 [bacterium]|jgi:small subunit ribosomal protein S15|nr:30S ribosomal protein S15 [bacterium]NDC94501.1 30S ribosomal protein S15 [bacterium]NDD85462.1 30S ribosomal protein S15 [bacterium]NDG29235.1 30S ribosomal protein S15 [bacterium]
MISTEKKAALTAEYGASKADVGSPSVQVAVLTERINELTLHLKVNKKDNATRRGLMQMVGKRKKLLKYIAETNPTEYLALIKKLGLRR